MTGLEKQLAIADALGAKWREILWLGEVRMVLSINSRPQIDSKCWELSDGRLLHSDIEDYCWDLSAAIRVVNRLANNSAIATIYGRELIREVLRFDSPRWDDTVTLNFWALTRLSNATAEQRINALLRALELWL